MEKKIYALVDCNNFFVSCERIFRPDLWGKPVAVLSSNDGCIVARSQEVKDLGIKMGTPLFKIRNIVDRYNIKLFSSNFTLYEDISNRIMRVLQIFTPDIEIYSVDESFLDLTNTHFSNTKNPINEYGEKIIKAVQRKVGIPVSVGIAPTKTLAKIANEYAKTQRNFNSVTNLASLNTDQVDKVLENIPVSDIWGIGRQNTKKLKVKMIFTAKDFKDANRSWTRQKLTVNGERTQLELQGIPCFEIDKSPELKKSITSSRLFGKYVSIFEEIKQSVAMHTAIVARKLRKQNSVAKYVTVYIRTNKHKENKYVNATTVTLPFPTDYTPELTKYAIEGLKQIFKPGLQYHKTGIYLTGIYEKGREQVSLFNEKIDTEEYKNKKKLMANVDYLNKKWNKEIVKTAVQGFTQNWRVKKDMVSPRYTTNWDEILKVKI